MKKNKILLVILLIVTLIIGAIGYYGYNRNKLFNEVLQYTLEIEEKSEIDGKIVINGIKLNNTIYIYHSLEKEYTVESIFWGGYGEISKMYSNMFFDNSVNNKKVSVYHIYGNEEINEIYYVSLNGEEVYDYYDGWKDEKKDKMVEKIIKNIIKNDINIISVAF